MTPSVFSIQIWIHFNTRCPNGVKLFHTFYVHHFNTRFQNFLLLKFKDTIYFRSDMIDQIGSSFGQHFTQELACVAMVSNINCWYLCSVRRCGLWVYWAHGALLVPYDRLPLIMENQTWILCCGNGVLWYWSTIYCFPWKTTRHFVLWSLFIYSSHSAYK